MMQKAALEVVWGNPKPSQRQPHSEPISHDSGTAHYQVQEFFSNCYRESLRISDRYRKSLHTSEVVNGPRT
jgi:hypothetical protein